MTDTRPADTYPGDGIPVPSFAPVRPNMAMSKGPTNPVAEQPIKNTFNVDRSQADIGKTQPAFANPSLEASRKPDLQQFIEKRSDLENNLVVLGPVNTIELGPHVALKNMYTGELIVRKDNQVETLADLRNIEDLYKDRKSLDHPNIVPIMEYKTEEILRIPMPYYVTKAYYNFRKENLRYIKELRKECKVEFREREFSIIAHNLVLSG